MMIIDSAAIRMQVSHYQQQRSQRSESLTITRNRPQPPNKQQPSTEVLGLSSPSKTASARKVEVDMEKQPDAMHALSIQIIRRLFKEITGQELQLFSPDQLRDDVEKLSYQEPLVSPSQASDNQIGLVYERSMSYYESETLSFSAEGSITTKDGRSIAFSVSLSMSRSFYVEHNLNIRAGAAAKIDPLIINFDGDAAELGNTHFEFDIDADGSLDQIAVLKSNSGMLALDKNQDGVINDGAELFGPQTGNGFAELAAYDEDGNQFIDEADSIYQRLRIWFRHADGSQQLVALGEKNVGAIYLGHLTSPFQLKDMNNTSLGEVVSSGIYLSEQGTVGTVQQINFTV